MYERLCQAMLIFVKYRMRFDNARLKTGFHLTLHLPFTIFAMSQVETYIDLEKRLAYSSLMNLDNSICVEGIRKGCSLFGCVIRGLSMYKAKGVSCFLMFNTGLSRTYQCAKLTVLRLLFFNILFGDWKG